MAKAKPRAVTMLNQQGDITIVWTEDEDDKMEAVIAKKMAEGIVFFIIEPRFFGLLPAKKTQITSADQARKHRAIAVRDQDFSAFLDSGSGEVVKTPDAPAESVRKASSAKDAASKQSVGVAPLKGG